MTTVLTVGNSDGAMDRIQDDIQQGRFGAELAHLANQLTAEALQATLF